MVSAALVLSQGTDAAARSADAGQVAAHEAREAGTVLFISAEAGWLAGLEAPFLILPALPAGDRAEDALRRAIERKARRIGGRAGPAPLQGNMIVIRGELSAGGLRVGGAALGHGEAGARLAALARALGGARLLLLDLADPEGLWPDPEAALAQAVAGLGVTAAVAVVTQGPHCARTGQAALPALIAAGAADAMGDGDGVSTVGEIAAFLALRQSTPDPACPLAQGALLPGAGPPGARVLGHPLESVQRMHDLRRAEALEAAMLPAGDSPAHEAFVARCVFCEAAPFDALDPKRLARIEAAYWQQLAADGGVGTAEHYLENCLVCAHAPEAQERLTMAQVAADEAAALALALERQDDGKLRAWLEACSACEGRALAEAALADALARDASRLAPCRSRAGLPQHGGPRLLGGIDAAAARQACLPVAAHPEAALLLGRVAQAEGEAETAMAAYLAGMEHGLPAAFGLAAHLLYAPPDGGAGDPGRAAAMAATGAELGDWLSRELLAVLYARGDVPGRNGADAADIARGLADEGSAAGQFLLGYFSLTGLGMAASDEAALLWLTAARDQGHDEAAALLAELAQPGGGLALSTEAAVTHFLETLHAAEPAEQERMIRSARDLGREGVRALQQHLQDAGLYRGGIDGMAGPQTRNALLEWLQKQRDDAG